MVKVHSKEFGLPQLIGTFLMIAGSHLYWKYALDDWLALVAVFAIIGGVMVISLEINWYE